METETVFDWKLGQEKPSCSLNTLLRNLNKIHNSIAWNSAFHKTLEQEHNSAKFFATFNKECPFSSMFLISETSSNLSFTVNIFINILYVMPCIFQDSFSTALFWYFTRTAFTCLFTTVLVFPSMHLKTLPVSTNYPIPKVPPHFLGIVSAAPHFLVLISAFVSLGCSNKYHKLGGLK